MRCKYPAMKYLTTLLNPLTNTFKLITLHNKSTHLFNSTFLNKCSEWNVIFVLLLIIQSHTRENIQTFLKVLQNALIFWSIFLFTRANIKTSLKVLQNASIFEAIFLCRNWTMRYLFMELKALATIPYFNFHFFPHLLIFLQFRDPSNVLNLSTKAVLQKCHN